MTLFLTIMVIGFLLDANAARIYLTVDEMCSDPTNTSHLSALASCPLLTSGYMSRLSTDCPDSHAKPIVQLISILRWDRIIVLFDPLHSEDLKTLLPDLGLATVHNLGDYENNAERKSLLRKLHVNFFPRLHFLLLSSYSTAVQLLQMVDRFDLESNRTTDFRHYSFWVVACYRHCQPSIEIPQLRHLENVILVYAYRNEPVVRQLMITEGGRLFSSEKDIKGFRAEDIFPNTRYGLNNRTITVSLLVHEPYIIKTKNGFEGHFIDILSAIASTLNFSCEIVHPEGMRWGEMIDGRWDGLVGQLERREVDLAVGTLSIHEDREKVMDFLYPPIFTKVDDIMYRLQEESTENGLIYLRPFKSTVLLCLLGVFVVVTLMTFSVLLFEYALLRRNKRLDTGTKCEVWTNLSGDIAVYLFEILLNRGNQFSPGTQTGTILLFTWGVFSVIIAACYSANLVAIFAVQKQTLPFTSFRELIRQKEYKWGFVSGDIREHIFNLSGSGDMKLAWDDVIELNRTDPEVLSENYSVHIAKVKAEKYAFIYTRIEIQKLRLHDCNINYVGEEIMRHQNGIGVPSGYPLSKDIENVLNAITDSGLPDLWWRRWGGLQSDECAPDKLVRALTLTDTASIFCLLFLGLGAAVVVFVMEIIKHRL